jgi:outer membrane protein, multidrug efflux system
MKKILLILIIAITFALGSCKVLSPAKMPELTAVPVSFREQQNQTAVADLPWRQFFQDKHLITLVDTALNNNLNLRIAHQRIEMAKSGLLSARSSLFPSINGITSAGARKYGLYTLEGVGNYDTNLSDNITREMRVPNHVPDLFIGLESSWEIDIWGKLRNQRKAAYARFLASQKGKHAVTTALVAEVASNYYELLALDTELEIIRKNIKLQETAVEMITIQKDGGRATELAVKQFKAQLVNTKSLEYEISQQIIQIENQLNTLLGRFPQAIERGKSIQDSQITPISAGIPATMLQKRPDIQQAELQMAAAKADVVAAKAAFFPNVTINANLGYQAFSSLLLLNPSSLAYGLIAGAATPLFNRNQVRANFRANEAAGLEAFYHYRQTVLNGYQEVSTSIRRIDNYENINRLKTEEVDMLHEAVSISKDLYFAGYASYLEVITAQKSVLEAELSQANAKKEQMLSMIQLYRSLGGGWE